MSLTSGLNHLGLSVSSLDDTTEFFVDCLGWSESGRDPSYPRTAVSDGYVRLTLWQVNHDLDAVPFDRRKNVGLHHVALQVNSLDELNALSQKVQDYPGVTIEFLPEPVGDGPRVHMMFTEPGGIRLELIWAGK
jgi:catechol 2,3-dioxygenase-like lactoylglutathione lyase family enzyme